MKKNVGTADKVIRLLLAGGILALHFLGVLSSIALFVIASILALTFLATAISGYCPLYTIFGFSSCPIKQSELEEEVN